jgi:hypothetical protein
MAWAKNKPIFKRISMYISKNQPQMNYNLLLYDVWCMSHSCETSLNLVLAHWKEDIDKGKIVVSVFLDVERAFETIFLASKSCNEPSTKQGKSILCELVGGPSAMRWFQWREITA